MNDKFRSRLKLLLKSKKRSDIIEKMSICPATLCRWLNGERYPQANHLIELAQKYPRFFKMREVIEWLKS